jgi:hypothetical protein
MPCQSHPRSPDHSNEVWLVVCLLLGWSSIVDAGSRSREYHQVDKGGTWPVSFRGARV